MANQIKDGKGTGSMLQVDLQNRAIVLAQTEALDYHINVDNGKVWSIPFEDLNPAGANDYVVYIKNTGDKDLRVSDIRVSCSAASQVEIHTVTGTASGGTAITPVARNLNSGQVPSATIESGTDITGLTNAGIIFFINCPVADTQYHIRTSSNINITKGKAIALLVENGSADLTGIVSLIEAE